MFVRGRELGRMESYCLMGIEFQLGKMKWVLRMAGDDDGTRMRMYLIPLSCTLKNG